MLKIKFFFLLILSLLFIGGFLSVLPNTAKAACSYTTNFTASKSSIDMSDTGPVDLTATISWSGQQSDCVQKVTFYFGYMMEGDNVYSFGSKNNIAFSGTTATATYKIDNFRMFYDDVKDDLADPTKIKFRAAYSTNAVSDKYTTISVSGIGVSGGQFGVSVLPPGPYSDGSSIKIKTVTDANSFHIDPSIQKVYVRIYVNETGNMLYTKTLDTKEVYNPSGYNGLAIKEFGPFTVNSANKFKTGANNIVVDFWIPSTSSMLGQGSVIVQVAGISTKQYACVGSDNFYKCGAKSDCSDISACSSNQKKVCTEIESSLCGTPPTNSGDNPVTTNPGDNPPSGSSGIPNETLYNPLQQDSLTGVFLFIVRGFLLIIAVWAVLFIIVGGFQMVMAAGNEETIIKAKKTITWAILGLVVALLSFSIVMIVQKLLGAEIKY